MKLPSLGSLGLLLVAATAMADTSVYDLDAKNAKEIADAISHVVTAQCIAGPTSVPVTNSSMCHVEPRRNRALALLRKRLRPEEVMPNAERS